ncbi:M23 family metallopeptidase [Actinokineospora iranica]|uniref:M23 family metallopeptidase n=1 Tax=Actinokineospora iranica TaxID=1271860 RepID=UPI000B8879CF|nr:M23 family metallopeptidase [Actinokineospora iranica]
MPTDQREHRIRTTATSTIAALTAAFLTVVAAPPAPASSRHGPQHPQHRPPTGVTLAQNPDPPPLPGAPVPGVRFSWPPLLPGPPVFGPRFSWPPLLPGPPVPGPRFSWPLFPPRPVARPFRPPTTPYGPGHRGVDLPGTPGEPVHAAADGVIAFAGQVATRGVVSIEHAPGLRTTYEPLTPTVTQGTRVRRGDRIGLLAPGHPGCPQTPACLHWGLRRGQEYLDPLMLLTTHHHVRLLPPHPGPLPPPDPTRHRPNPTHIPPHHADPRLHPTDTHLAPTPSYSPNPADTHPAPPLLTQPSRHPSRSDLLLARPGEHPPRPKPATRPASTAVRRLPVSPPARGSPPSRSTRSSGCRCGRPPWPPVA